MLLLIPALLVFLYALYKLVKDDYLFIRKSISPEQIFDIAFLTIIISLFFSRIFFFILHPAGGGENYSLVFFSFIKKGGLSLTGAVIGGILALYLISKYKKIPLGRIFDFFTLSFLIALPVGFLSQLPLLARNDMIITIFNAVLYFILIVFFIKFLYPKILNKTMKEGSLSILFVIYFSLTSLFTSLLNTDKSLALFNLHNILLSLLLFFSFLLLLKQEKRNNKGRRTISPN